MKDADQLESARPISPLVDAERDRSQNGGSSSQPMSFDDYLSSRIGFGLYQVMGLAVCCQIDFVDGSEQYYMMILVQVLKKEWNLSSSDVELLGSFFSIGLFIGAIISGIMCDQIGRKKALIYGSILQIITVGLTSIAQSFFQILLIRTMYGIVVGISLPIGILLVMEIVPKHLRGRLVILLTTSYVLGKLYLLLLSSIFLTDLTSGNWRAIALCQLFPIAGIILGCIFIQYESPRYLISKGHFDAGFKILDEIGMLNHGKEDFIAMTVAEKESIKQWQVNRFNQAPSTLEVVKGLFRNRNIDISWRLILSICIIYFAGSGLTFMLPFLVHENNTGNGIMSLFIATIGEIPAQIIAFLVIDLQAVGRIRAINIFLFFSFFVYGFIYTTRQQYLVFGLMMVKFVLRFLNVCLIPMIAESYDTFHRSMGLGVSASIGRGFAALAPFILYELFLYDQWLIFVFYAVLTMIFLSATLTFPIDMTNRPLDEDHSRIIEKRKKEEFDVTKIDDVEETETLLNQNSPTRLTNSVN